VKDWKELEQAVKYAKDEKAKRRACFAIVTQLEKAPIPELEKIIQSAKDEFIRNRAEIELWWQEFDKKPKNLMKLIQTSNEKEKIQKAVDKLGDLKYWDAVGTLIGFLEDIDLRDSAASALRKMPTQESFEPLVQSIKQHPDGAECLLYALQVLDCSDAAELLVDLFISKPSALIVRYDIYVCFAEKAVKCIPKQIKDRCCSKLLKAIEKSQDLTDTKELEQLYNSVNQIEEV
jgi:hypothetical protein